MSRLRELSCELGVLERADGSARLVQGSTAVLCAVYGPAEVKVSREHPDRATLDVTLKPASGQSGPRERLLEEMVGKTCEALVRTTQHPHTAISITLQVERNQGSLLSVLLNACCLALMDACIPLSSTFSTITCGLSKDTGELLLDPDLQQEGACQALVTVCVEESSGGVVLNYADGKFTIEQLGQCLSAAKESSKSLTKFYRDTISRKLSKDAKFANFFS